MQIGRVQGLSCCDRMRRLLAERDGDEVGGEHAGGFGAAQRPPAQESHVGGLASSAQPGIWAKGNEIDIN